MKVTRRGDRHDLTDLTVAVRFEGDYDESYTAGDNAGVLPTDTMKNTVYALAGRHELTDPESFGLRLAEYFLDRNARVRRVSVDLVDHRWRRIAPDGREAGCAFVREGAESRTATIAADRQTRTIGAGVADLVILKSARSAFTGFVRDELTTLPETTDRILATSMTATWEYLSPDMNFGIVWRAVCQTLLDTFARHDSASVQHTLYAMGQAVLDAIDDVSSIHLVMPNKHHLPVDLARFGLENRNEIFVATDEPYGRIEATLKRN